MEINSYVMPVFRRPGDERSFAGTAFCIDGYLVTAGHVLSTPQTYYVRNGEDWHPLEHLMWIPRQVPAADQHGYDVAFYPVPGLRSPLSLADADAEPDSELEVLCWQWKPNGLRQVSTRSLVLKEPDEQAYLRIATIDRITHGSSGCPVFRDGKVYGIVTMGRDYIDSQHMTPLGRKMEENTCWVFKTSRMRSFLPDQ